MKLKKDKGQSLFEVVIALAMGSLIIVSVVVLATLSIKSATFSREKTSATFYAQQAAEWIRGQRDNNYEVFISQMPEVGTSITYCLDSLDWSSISVGQCVSGYDEIPNTRYLREVIFTHTVDGKDLYQADITVEWSDSIGLHTTKVSTILTDWR